MQDILIGTLVPDNDNIANYLGQILPHGFESFSLTTWQTPLKNRAKSVKKALKNSNAVISSLSPFGNALEYDEMAALTRQNFIKAIDYAEDYGTNLVTGFAGRLRGKAIEDNLERFVQVWTPIVEYAVKKNVRIAFENCNMGGNWAAGDWNIAICPDAWELIFAALPSDHLGLQWEPCHQMTLLIDPLPQIAVWGHKFFAVHGKDATVRRDLIARHGFGGKYETVFHRTPGFGDSNWTDIISELRRAKFTGSIDIEGWHDPVYRGDLEMTGQVHALRYLKACRGGDFVANPQ